MPKAVLEEIQKAIMEAVNENKMMKQFLSPDTIFQLAKSLAKTLAEDPKVGIDASELKNPSPTMKDSLRLAFMGHAKELTDPKCKFDYKSLFSAKDDLENDKDFQDRIKNVFKDMLKLKMKDGGKLSKEEEEKQLKMLASSVTTILASKKEPGKSLANSEAGAGFFMQLENEYRMLVGAAKPGEVFIPIQGVPAGNQAGVQDLLTSGLSYLGVAGNPSGEADPLAARANSALNDIASGATQGFDQQDFDRSMAPSSRSPNPFDTKLHPH